jgi:hypothetical protein
MAVEQPGNKQRHRRLGLPTGTAEIWLERSGGRVAMHTTFPNGSGTAYWDACQSEGCLGEAVDRNARCLLHATPDMREQYLSSLTNGELQRLSLRGVSVSQELLGVVLRSHIFRDKRVMIPLDLTGADMDARETLADYKFDQYVTLNGSIIREQKGFRFEVASVYRDLRRSVELRADQPGAADFYYGEMEMRRHSTERGLPEQAVVWIYWALSGYGLRALRAFFALLLLVCAGTLALRYTGFESGCVTFQKAAIFSLRSIVPGMRYQESLTPAGSVIEIVLRAVSPLLIALWILALRNRVKR